MGDLLQGNSDKEANLAAYKLQRGYFRLQVAVYKLHSVSYTHKPWGVATTASCKLQFDSLIGMSS